MVTRFCDTKVPSAGDQHVTPMMELFPSGGWSNEHINAPLPTPTGYSAITTDRTEIFLKVYKTRYRTSWYYLKIQYQNFGK